MTKHNRSAVGDFTEANYRRLLRIAKRHWRFIPFPEYKGAGRTVLWRHDIDFSVQRAGKLARIEAEEKVRTTYFIDLHNPFYNALEKENARLIHEILDLGHDVGLHFDAAFYEARSRNMEKRMATEKYLLERLLATEIRAVSFHNPGVAGRRVPDNERLAGMVNAYSGYLKKHYGYCSDSNGYWRFHRLEDVLRRADDANLQVLTHPGWWTPRPMSPRDRISRCIDGRAARLHKLYDDFLKTHGRVNVR